MIRFAFILFLIFIAGVPVLAQKKIKYDADTLRNERRKSENVQFLWYHVIFQQETTTVTNDSSVYYRGQNLMESFRHIRIVDDSTTITADRLTYDGNSRTASLRQHVIYAKGDRRLYTDHLDYNMVTEVGEYSRGGKLIDSTNTLTSKSGFFYGKQNIAVFWTNVVLVSPDFTLKTDTLRYNTLTKVAYTDGPTEITNQDGTELLSQGGVFRTIIDQSQFIDGHIETTDYILEGKELFFDDLKKYYKSEGDVILTYKSNDLIITGQEAYYDKQKGYSKIYGNAVMKRVMEADTFYMAADTLVAIESEYDSVKRVLAYPDIRIFRSNLQGLADSVAYFLHDSLIYMYGTPILWTLDNQIAADTIEMEMAENEIKKMVLHQNSFLISQDTMKHFNQVKGRNMTAFFDNNDLYRIEVDGNGETIFYLLDEGDSVLLGMNRLLCSDMAIRFKNNQISTITVFKMPEGKIIPPHELEPSVERLDGFNWQDSIRPTLEDIYTKPENLHQRHKTRTASRTPGGAGPSRSQTPKDNPTTQALPKKPKG